MAHACPDCGQTCYCGGDIDDIELHGTIEEMRCNHCLDAEEDEDDYDDYEEVPDATE